MTTTQDAFLGGRIRVAQPREGYRAGADPVFLAAAVPVRAGESVLELGCGVGVAMLCLLARVPDVAVTGVEREEDFAALAEANLASNGFSGTVEVADIAALPSRLRDRSFDHVIANPPFFDRARGSAAAEKGREAGRGEETPLAVWLDVAVRRLAPGGSLTIVQRAERLADCLAVLDDRVGSVTVQPLSPRAGRPAKLFVLQAKKGAKGAFRLNAPLVLHEGDRHLADGESYTPEAQEILRNGAALRL